MHGSHHSWPSAGASSRARLPQDPRGPAPAALAWQVAQHLGAHAPQRVAGLGCPPGEGVASLRPHAHRR